MHPVDTFFSSKKKKKKIKKEKKVDTFFLFYYINYSLGVIWHTIRAHLVDCNKHYNVIDIPMA